MAPDLLPRCTVTPTHVEASRRHLLTVALEDYFHVGAFNQLIQRGQWYRFERRLEQGTRATLELLGRHGHHATFFVLGWVADQVPELVRLVAEQGHEVASKGYYHRSIREMAPEEFREDLARAREAIERASGRRVLGYRVADRWFEPTDLWALDVLVEEGYAYDSSIAPRFRAYARQPWRRFAHVHRNGERVLHEFPISAARLGGFDIPIAGGNYFRQFPHRLVRRAVAHWHRAYAAPFVLYFHTWELDPDQPKIAAAPLLARVRQYRNLGRMPAILDHYLSRYQFASAATHLGLDTTLRAPLAERRFRPTPIVTRSIAPAAARTRTPVTVVIPCYNEELILPYLANTLASVRAHLASRYDLRFTLVDDCSTDGTWGALQRLFGSRADCRLLRHDSNLGVAAGILDGIRDAETEIVCSIDCDCTYDPHELGDMIAQLTDGVDMVTASPYHPAGGVHNVPGWRLFLSRTLSRLYRVVLHHRLYTYTSCFRVYRRGAMIRLRVERTGFLGVAEMLGRLDLAGGRIVEHPAILEVRMLGRSKMKILRTIAGHLRLLAQLAILRLGPRREAAATAPTLPELGRERARV